jgi:hypothetical protein
LNYTGDNSGMLLNPQKFRSSMASVFGPDDCHTVLTSILDSCVQCTFKQSLFIKRILELFPAPDDEKRKFYTKIQCMFKRIYFV